MRLLMLWKFWREPYLYIIMTFSFLNLGCIHTRHIHDSFSEELERTNEELAGKRVQIALLPDSTTLSAENVYLSADSLYYVEKKTNEQKRIAISEVQRITTRNHGRGALEGFVGGLLIWGGLVGTSLILVAAFPDDPSADGPGGGLLVYYFMLGGAPLPILGTIIGAAAGSRKIYVLSEE